MAQGPVEQLPILVLYVRRAEMYPEQVANYFQKKIDRQGWLRDVNPQFL